jgi:YfiH family protein
MRIEYKESDTLNDIQGIRHGYFTKHGGVSSGIYASLNCALNSEDVLENVLENRQRALVALGLHDTHLFGLNQIHSTTVHVIDKDSEDDFYQGDALVTKQSGISLSVLGADCAPLLFADKQAGVIGAAHAGWKGAVSGIVEAVVTAMCEQGASRENIHACIGPTIHQESYEVQNDFIQQLQKLSDFATDQFLLNVDNRSYFDLPAYLLEQCQRSAISGENLGLDTYMLEHEFFSFRRNTHAGLKEYGRQMSVIGKI